MVFVYCLKAIKIILKQTKDLLLDCWIFGQFYFDSGIKLLRISLGFRFQFWRSRRLVQFRSNISCRKSFCKIFTERWGAHNTTTTTTQRWLTLQSSWQWNEYLMFIDSSIELSCSKNFNGFYPILHDIRQHQFEMSPIRFSFLRLFCTISAFR